MPRYFVLLILCLVIVATVGQEVDSDKKGNPEKQNTAEKSTKLKKPGKTNKKPGKKEKNKGKEENETIGLPPMRFSKIVGGRNTDISAVPYQVSLQINGRHVCGGSILQPTFILTAAHCVEKGTAKHYSIRAGSNYHMMGGEVRQVIRIIRHPYYDTKLTNYDAAVLELEDPLPTNKKIMAVPVSKIEPTEGQQLVVSGWGALQEKSRSHTTLQSVIVPVVSRQKCKILFTQSHTITNAMVCAGYIRGGKDACQGDSGGPAVSNGKQVGIVSWGKGCARRGVPGIYTNVALIEPWIKSQLP